MEHSSAETVTGLLDRVQGGDRAALDELLPHIYAELHVLAHRQRSRWRGDYTLNTTALVHEAYLKLVDQKQARWETRAHFFAAASRAMRHILINYARDRRRQKRGGDRIRLSFEEVVAALEEKVLTEERADLLVALDEALGRLEQISSRQAEIVTCRFFGGMTGEETAAALGLSPATVNRGWTLAKLWLYRELRETR